MNNGWLAGFVLLVVALGVFAVLSGGLWLLFAFFSRRDRSY